MGSRIVKVTKTVTIDNAVRGIMGGLEYKPLTLGHLRAFVEQASFEGAQDTKLVSVETAADELLTVSVEVKTDPVGVTEEVDEEDAKRAEMQYDAGPYGTGTPFPDR